VNGFDWNEANINHIARHGVTPAEVEETLTRKRITSEPYFVKEEERRVVHGMTEAGRLLSPSWLLLEMAGHAQSLLAIRRERIGGNMARNSSKTENRPPTFKSEAEEANWLASPAGRRFTSRHVDRSVRKGTAKVETAPSAKRTDPAVLQALVDRVAAKQTQAVSIRITLEDLNAAKRMAKIAGIGYQTVLKEIIHNGVQGAWWRPNQRSFRSYPRALLKA
jgi:hypothetical protein